MESICLAIQTNYLYNGNDLDYWEFFGIKYVSFIYFGFTKWLYDLTKDQDNLYFLARDGYIPYQIYEKFNKDKKIYTKGTYEITAEIDEFIAFVKKGSDVIKCFE